MTGPTCSSLAGSTGAKDLVNEEAAETTFAAAVELPAQRAAPLHLWHQRCLRECGAPSSSAAAPQRAPTAPCAEREVLTEAAWLVDGLVAGARSGRTEAHGGPILTFNIRILTFRLAGERALWDLAECCPWVRESSARKSLGDFASRL